MADGDETPRGLSGVSGAARVAAALALLAVIALASRARFHGGGAFGPTTVGGVTLAFLTAIVAVTVLVGLLLAGYTATGRTRGRTKLLATVLVALLAAALIASFWHAHPRALGDVNGGTACAGVIRWSDFLAGAPNCIIGRAATQPGAGRAGRVRKGSETVALAAAAGLAALLVLAIAAIVIGARRRPGLDEPAPEDPMLEALDESIDDLHRERDVRRAIIACYARMERALGRAGAARRASETPFEYLARVLERIARDPGRSLTELFERAKFSVEPMGEAEKARAIAALEALRAASMPGEEAA